MTLDELAGLVKDAQDLIDGGTEITMLFGAVHRPIIKLHLILPEETVYLDCNDD